MKVNRGWQHFLMRGLEKVQAEMNVQMLTYHFQRVLNIVRIVAFKNHLKQRMAA